MMNFESLLAGLHAPRRLRPAQEFIGPNLRVTDSRIAGIADADNFLTGPDDAQIVISNPRCIRLGVFRLDHAYKNATVKNHNQPSLCDFIISAGDDTLLILLELTQQLAQYIDGAPESMFSRNPKREKAREQLISTIKMLSPHLPPEIPANTAGRKAVFGFIITEPAGVAARTLKAFSMRPTLTEVTLWREDECPEWQFISIPHPKSFEI